MNLKIGDKVRIPDDLSMFKISIHSDMESLAGCILEVSSKPHTTYAGVHVVSLWDKNKTMSWLWDVEYLLPVSRFNYHLK